MRKCSQSQPNYPTDVRDKLCFQNIEFSGREVPLQDGYEIVEKYWHYSIEGIFWNACKPLSTYLTYLICIKTYALYAYCIICIINNAHYTYMHNISIAKATIWLSKATHCLCLHFARLNIWRNILLIYELLNWHEPLFTYLTKPMLYMHNPSLSHEI